MTTSTLSSTDWRQLGAVAPRALTDARLQLHHSLLPPRPDDSHTNFGWVRSADALATHLVPAPTPFRAALRPASLELLLLDAANATLFSLALHGRTVDEAFNWLASHIATTGADAKRLTAKKHYEIPAHLVGTGRAFDAADLAPFRELASGYANAARLFGRLAAATPGASDVRLWPHHFDLATLITVREAAGGAGATTIGVGHSPGDEWYDEPYCYVSPYPAPAVETPPALPTGGHWHRTKWFGAVLTSTDLVAAGGAAAQAARASAFVDGAVAAARGLLAVG
jgi:hypothetical protein